MGRADVVVKATLGVLISALAVLLGLPAIASATYPGQNGRIYFVCRPAGAAAAAPGDICAINPDGSGLVNLTNTSDQIESEPEVSSDGSQISFIRGSGDVARVWVMNADGTNQVQVSDLPSTGTAWTPNGQIAFRAKTGSSSFEFRLVASTGGASTFLHAANASDSPPRYTSSGTWLYGKFVPVSPGSGTLAQQVFVVNGTTETQVTASDPLLTSNSFPSFSPNGSSVLYNRSDFTPGFGGDLDIYMVPSTGGAEVQLTNTNGPVDEIWPSLSPDGTKLLYQQKDVDHDFFHQHLIIANADGSNPVPIATPTLASAQFPVWSPVSVQPPPPPPVNAAFTATAPKKATASKPVPVTLRCIGDTRCAVRYEATLVVPLKNGPPKKFRIKPKSVTLGAGTNLKVALKIPNAAKGPVRKSLKAGKEPLIKALAVASQPDGPLIRKVNLNIGLKL